MLNGGDGYLMGSSGIKKSFIFYLKFCTTHETIAYNTCIILYIHIYINTTTDNLLMFYIFSAEL